MRLLYVLALLSVANFSFSQPQLLKDIDPSPGTPTNYASGTNKILTKFKNKVYFTALSTESGKEIFTTDGTTSGTAILTELYPGARGVSGVIVPIPLNSDLFLFATEAEDGFFLWKTDGTSGGTQKITELQVSSLGEGTTVLNNVAYFSATDPDHGYELWRSDGTAVGTYMVKDVFPGAQSGMPGVMAAGQSQIFFVGNDGTHGSELWRSDGTAEGTTMVKDILPADQAMTSWLTGVGNDVYFKAAKQVWKSDGTEAGTVAVTSFTNASPIFDEHFFQIGDKLLFTMYLNYGVQWFTMDRNTGAYSSLNGNHTQSYFMPTQPGPVMMNGIAYFIHDYDGTRYGVFKTDGTAANTSLAFKLDFIYANSYVEQMVASGNKIYLTYEDYLRVSDGSSVPQKTVYTAPGDTIEGLDGKVILATIEPTVVDGSLSSMLKDLNTSVSYTAWYPLTVGDHMMFAEPVYNNGTYNYNLWNSNGTESGTLKLKNFQNVVVGYGATIGNQLLFHGNIAGVSNIWISDGTSAGTKILKEGNWYKPNGADGSMRSVGNNVFIFAGNKELWKTDGTSGGTVKVATLPFESSSTHINFKNQLYFVGQGQLWKSDGTETGTSKVADIITNQNLWDVSSITPGTNKFYFLTKFGEQAELWVSDGTFGGTTRIKQVNQVTLYQSGLVYGQAITVVNDIAYMALANDKGSELWRSDGTSEGTYPIKDIYAGSTGSFPFILGAVGNTIYFSANDKDHGYELWKTEGTEATTVMVKDILPGRLSSLGKYPTSSVAFDGKVYFAADDGTHGSELWVTSGTEAGTALVADINPGSKSSLQGIRSSMITVGTKLYFPAIDAGHGREMWVYESGSGNEGPVSGIEDHENSVSVYPNPATTSLLITGSSHVILRDLLGREVISATSSGKEISVDVHHLPRGLYVVTMKTSGNANVSRKVVLH